LYTLCFLLMGIFQKEREGTKRDSFLNPLILGDSDGSDDF
jgi:hypothetical protein